MIDETERTGQVQVNARLPEAFPGVDRGMVYSIWMTGANIIKNFIDTHPEHIYEMIDEPSYGSVACKRGCSHCCHIKADVFTFEANRLWKLYKRDQDERVAEQATYEQQDYLKKSRDQAACVFLKNNECSIYSQRPYVCRNLYVYTPPAHCDERTYPGAQSAQYTSLKNMILESILWRLLEFKSIPQHFKERIDHDKIRSERR